MVGAVLLPIAVVAALSPLVISEVSSFAASMPTLQHHIDEILHNWGIADQVNQAIDRLNLQAHVADFAVVGVQETVTVVVETFTIVVIGAYLLADSQRLQVMLHEFTPRDAERHIEPLLEGMERVVGGYIRGQILTSAMFGVYAGLLCLVLGVPNPLLLGIIAAIGDIIPLFGVPAAMVITVVVAFTSSVWQPVAVVIGYVIYGQLESHILVPRIYARTVNMSPLMVIIATIAGGALDGFTGIFVAIPVVGALKVLLDYIVAERLKGREAAVQAMHAESTDPVGREQEARTEEAGGVEARADRRARADLQPLRVDSGSGRRFVAQALRRPLPDALAPPQAQRAHLGAEAGTEAARTRTTCARSVQRKIARRATCSARLPESCREPITPAVRTHQIQ